jgi:hypothetical protein
MAFGFEKAFCFHRRHTPRTCSSYRLTVDAILHVSGVKYSCDVGSSAPAAQNVAL